MHRSDKEIIGLNEIEEIIKKADVCRIAVTEHSIPYIIPMCFGYSNQTLYFHSAKEGKKLSILQRNPQACFEMDIDTKVVPSHRACQWSMTYHSVIGLGEVEFIENIKDKREAMQYIMQHYGEHEGSFTDEALAGVTLFKLMIKTITGKKSD